MEMIFGIFRLITLVVVWILVFVVWNHGSTLESYRMWLNHLSRITEGDDKKCHAFRRFLPNEPCQNGGKIQSADHIFVADEKPFHMTRNAYFMKDGKLDRVEYIFWSNEDRSKEPIIFDDSDISHCVRVVSLLSNRGGK